MTSSTPDLPSPFSLQTSPQQQRRTQYSTLIMVIVALLAVLGAVLLCSWVATRALLPPSIDESGRSRLNADYSAWALGAPLLEIDIPRLATAAARGEGDWNEGNLPAGSTDEPTEAATQGSTAPDATDGPTPTTTATGSPTPTMIGGTGAPTATKASSTATTGPTQAGSTNPPPPTVPGSTNPPPPTVPGSTNPPPATNTNPPPATNTNPPSATNTNPPPPTNTDPPPPTNTPSGPCGVPPFPPCP